MTSDRWIEETLYTNWRQRFLVERELVCFPSKYQEIVIFESRSHGRVLMLDGVVQVTEADEFIYQEMLSHVPLVAHGGARRVLIIGAGDGGVLRRVLQHSTVEHVTMVEIDGDVIRLSRQFLPNIAGDAWDDPRATVVVGDGIAYVEKARSGSFDVIIVDSTDPIGVGEVLFTDEFYKQASRVLGPQGVIVNQCGVPSMQASELRDTTRRRSRHFKQVSAYVIAVPTYVGGFMTVGMSWKTDGPLARDADAARRYAAESGWLGKTEYWTPDIHAACFALPPYIKRHLEFQPPQP